MHIVRTDIQGVDDHAEDKQLTGYLSYQGPEGECAGDTVPGFQLRGIITGFDCFVVVLDSEGRQQVIYKHAISTIAPARNVTLWEDAE